ncbi:transposable element tc3 transposase-like protein [Holotrichia oblita]|uniref:Transposable element tc3 transposase-like protein n=1 Tax=Holotrichia oblita TaxID=644536 RepID=A0ACB9SUY4_HOLOL|nr:transposable element tc3 transposase-like protein [Holotrichia oblita]
MMNWLQKCISIDTLKGDNQKKAFSADCVIMHGSFVKPKRRQNNENNENIVLQAVVESPLTSLELIKNTLAVARSTAGTILKRAKFKPYRDRASQGLQNGEEIRRAQFCHWFIEKHNENPNVLAKMLWSDESRFTYSGMFNRKNTIFWSDENPHIVRGIRQQVIWEFNVWIGVIDTHIIGPFFFNENLNSERCGFFLLLAITAIASEKVKVSIFYETHCPCSISFIKKQLYPNYFKLDDRLDVELIPYGNTKRTLLNGTTEFHCKKDATCRAMRIHACAAQYLTPPNITLHFLNCLMDTQYTQIDIIGCAMNFSFPLEDIQNCFSDGTSSILLDKFGNRTEKLPSAHIPAIAFNDEYDDRISQQARENFLVTVCSVFKDEVPSTCSFINSGFDGNVV